MSVVGGTLALIRQNTKKNDNFQILFGSGAWYGSRLSCCIWDVDVSHWCHWRSNSFCSSISFQIIILSTPWLDRYNWWRSQNDVIYILWTCCMAFIIRRWMVYFLVLALQENFNQWCQGCWKDHQSWFIGPSISALCSLPAPSVLEFIIPPAYDKVQMIVKHI